VPHRPGEVNPLTQLLLVFGPVLLGLILPQCPWMHLGYLNKLQIACLEGMFVTLVPTEAFWPT
jgi:hypothetical protein